jgi:hypothetical protein
MRPEANADEEVRAADDNRRRRWFPRDSSLRNGVRMYGHHPHTGIGAMVLTLVAAAKGGIGFLVRVIAQAQHAH